MHKGETVLIQIIEENFPEININLCIQFERARLFQKEPHLHISL